MTKKILVFLIAAVLSLSLVACGSGQNLSAEDLAASLIPSGAESNSSGGLATYFVEKPFTDTYQFITNVLKEKDVKSVEEGLPSERIVDEAGNKLKEWMYIGAYGKDEMPVIVSLVGNEDVSNVVIAVGEEAAQAIAQAAV